MFTNVTYVDLTGHRGKNEHFINFQLSVLLELEQKMWFKNDNEEKNNVAWLIVFQCSFV